MQACFRPFVIAEIGVNHGGDLALAKKLIEQCREGGADAAKFQTYKAEKIAAKKSPAYWDTSKEAAKNQFELFKRYDSFGEQEYRALAEHCRNVGIEFMSTPFDLEAADFLDPLVRRHKIASADLTNIPLLRRLATKKKPILLSTGAATHAEIAFAEKVLQDAGATEITLLHCVLNYPTPDDQANLGRITQLKEVFGCRTIGYSDHTVPDEEMVVLTTACLLGAEVVEKHFTHDKTLPGNDHYHAMNCEDLKRFRDNLQRLADLYGNPSLNNVATQGAAREHARRSIVAARAITAGEVFSEANLICKRPAHGLSPIYWDEVVGKVAARDLAADTLLGWGDVTEPNR